MLNKLKSEYSEQAYRRGVAINKLLVKLKGQRIEKQLTEVNRFFNQFEYQEDHVHWGVQDYWATPNEFIGTRKGDCEDFVIAKYFALRKLGVPDERLYLTYVKALKQNVAHMVLSYFPKPSSIRAKSPWTWSTRNRRAARSTTWLDSIFHRCCGARFDAVCRLVAYRARRCA